MDSGVRACLAEEFSSIHVLNLRGNQRTQGERSRREGGKVFGQGSRAPVAITILVRNPEAAHDGCRILYRDIGDYLKREGRCCTARSKSLTSLCRLQSHPAQYVSGIPSAAILLNISHPIRCSTRCLANVRARISGPMIAL